MSRNSAKSAYYARITKSCKKHNIEFNDFKQNPALLFAVDPLFRRWIYHTFDPRVTCTWWGKQLTWAKLISELPDNIFNVIENEDKAWYDKLQEVMPENILDTDEDDLFVTDETSTTQEKGTKNKPDTQEVEDSGQKDPKYYKTAPDSIPEKSEPSTSKGGKRAGSELTDQTDIKKKAPAETTNVATKINDNTGNQPQANPTGAPEVDQTKDQQLQTPSGNAHNERGTLQGEAGNLKIQKPLEKYGIVKVNMAQYSQSQNQKKVFVFILKNKELSNDLMEIMEETYDSGEIYTALIDSEEPYVNDLKYIVAWRLPFNISYTTIGLKLGNRYNRELTFTKMIHDFENVKEILEQAVLVRLKNDVQIHTLSEIIEKTQADANKYNNPETKKRKFCSKFE